jgi:NADPH-dependent ferric siderophore reductase
LRTSRKKGLARPAQLRYIDDIDVSKLFEIASMNTQPANFPASLLGRPQRPTWRLTVVGARDVTPRMREVSLIGDDLGAFSYRPGQDLVLGLPAGEGVARRHYTIRRFDRQEQRLDIQFVLHGSSPAVRWATSARLGETILAEGPRGRTAVSGEADWRLFTGDETGLPGIAAMIESLPAGERAIAFVEVASAADEQPIETAANLEICWLHRHGDLAAPSWNRTETLAAFQLPAGVGQACVIGETGAVRAQRQGLIARGLPKSQIAAEGYWRPGRIGGHDHVNEPDVLGAIRGGGRRMFV